MAKVIQVKYSDPEKIYVSLSVSEWVTLTSALRFYSCTKESEAHQALSLYNALSNSLAKQ